MSSVAAIGTALPGNAFYAATKAEVSMYPVFDWSLLCSGEIKMSFPFRRV